jgi:hypothetical protein
MIPEWLNPIVDFFNEFVAYFQSQTVPVQALLIVLAVLAFVAAGFVVYGALWVAYQAVKGAIVGTILLVWLAIAGVVLLFTVFFDAKKAESMWKDISADMKWFANKAYPPKNQNTAAVPAPGTASEATPARAPRVSAQAASREVPAEIDIPASKMKGFCTACGSAFSNQMHSLLGKKASCFCEHCGQRFTIQDAMLAPVQV